jgi:SAM-dependent methyltransferase
VSTRAGELDWLQRWQDMQSAAEVAQGESEHSAGEDRWKHRAARFDRVSRGRPDGVLDLLGADLRVADVVADLGAGAGRHAILLARRCAEVLAVEPSAAMRARMEARIAEERLTNITIVAEPWPCTLPIVDVAFSSHVLYGVTDVARFLGEMTRAARRTCALLLGLRAPVEGIAPLWQAMHGAVKPPRPAALEALGVLHQLGHHASLRIVPGSERLFTFSPTEGDLDELCHRLSVPADAPGRQRVTVALDTLYPRPSPESPWTLGTLGPNALLEWSGTAS